MSNRKPVGEVLLARVLAEFASGGWSGDEEKERNEGMVIAIERALEIADGGVYYEFRTCVLAGAFEWEFFNHPSDLALILYQVGAAFAEAVICESRWYDSMGELHGYAPDSRVWN
jgi:hypothetical protein